MSYDPLTYWEERAFDWSTTAFDTEIEWTAIEEYIDPLWSVLELGCGTGRWSEYFTDYEGWDVSPTLIAYARECYPDVPFKIRATAGEIATHRDLIFTWTNLLHIPPEVISTLKFPGNARLLFVEPHTKSTVDYCFDHDYQKLFNVTPLKQVGSATIWGKNL